MNLLKQTSNQGNKMINLKEVLELHQKWLNNEEGGKRANLSCAILSGANFSGANLRCAILNGANLSYAILNGADLNGANLSGANLRYANFSGANLRGANLSCAILSGANLRYAILNGADLNGANLAEGFIADGKFHYITNVGSEKGTLEIYKCQDEKWFIRRGCFSGSKEEFLQKVNETHGNNEFSEQYRALIALFCK
jgi:hypothetical protein